MKYLIIDDEPIAHDIIKEYCEAFYSLKLAESCYNALEAMEYLKNNKVDLIFLDVKMPKLTGFDFLRTLVESPKIIVTTAYSEFALEGYELNVVDYLLKPFSFERFAMAINKLGTWHQTPSANPFNATEGQKRIFLRTNRKYVQIHLNSILFVEAEGNYCKVVTTDEDIQIREKISDFINELPGSLFIQVHKSFIVSKNHIKSIEGNQIKILDYTIPIGQLFKRNINELLQ